MLFCSENVLPNCRNAWASAQLSMIGFKSNQISSVPATSLPPLLRWLILTDNHISQLPDELGERPLLQN